MAQQLAQALLEAIDREFAKLEAITEQDAGAKPDGAWSRKEELGHLIDSATNNHVRFVRASLEEQFRGLGYEQDAWVGLHAYSDLPWATLLQFWRQYNLLLVHLVHQIPEERLPTPCIIGSSATVTLGFLIEDYTLHMQHHLDHILGRDKVTQYPGAAVGV